MQQRTETGNRSRLFIPFNPELRHSGHLFHLLHVLIAFTMKKLLNIIPVFLLTTFVFLLTTFVSCQPGINQLEFTCADCKKDDKAWCTFNSKDKKVKICIDKTAAPFCDVTLSGNTSLDCEGLTDADQKTFVPPLPVELPKTCGKCIDLKKQWCVSDLVASKAKFCVPQEAADSLCLNGKVYSDCKDVGKDDQNALFMMGTLTCEKCVEGFGKTLSWCVTQKGVLNVRACFPDRTASILCFAGKSYKTCDTLSYQNRKASVIDSAGTAALSAFVAAGVLLAAVI